MCSVVGCDSSRRGAQRFELPEDPEMRLQWVRFLATANKHRFKESNWTEIKVCSEHFKSEYLRCDEDDAAGKVQLRPGAVPFLCVRSKAADAEPVENTMASTCDPLPSVSEESRLPSPGSPIQQEDSCSTDTSDVDQSEILPENDPNDLAEKSATPPNTKGREAENENQSLKLYNWNCRACQLEMTRREVAFNQQCPQCEYRKQWMNRTPKASSPTAEEEGSTEQDDEDANDEEEEDSDEEWHQQTGAKPTTRHRKDPEEQNEDTEEDEVDTFYDYSRISHKPNHELCSDCGKLFNKRWPHTCEHILKPYSCNICGKRCVTEYAVATHSRIHEDKYEYRCKYCYMTFRTKVDKVSHQEIHQTEGRPYNCSLCSEKFATNKDRELHMEDHTGPKQLKCHICEKEFAFPLALQRHLNVHTGLRPHKCSVCDRCFSQAGHLKSHMRLHTGERPYKCQLCDKCFNHNVSLKSHVQRYHTSGSGNEQNKTTSKERASDSSDAQGCGNKGGEFSVEKERDPQFIAREKRLSRRRTGRPLGRPKSYTSAKFVLTIQQEDRCLNGNTEKSQAAETLSRTQSTDDEQSDSNTTISNLAEDEREKKIETKNTTKAIQRKKKPRQRL